MLSERLQRYAPAQYAAEQCRRVELLQARLEQAMQRKLERYQNHLNRTSERLEKMPPLLLDRQRARLSACAGRLQALSPLSVLARGFSMVTDQKGTLVADSKQITPGDVVQLRFASGTAQARIQSVTQEREESCQKN